VAIYAGDHIRWFCILDNGEICSLSLGGELRIFEASSGRYRRQLQLAGPRNHRVVLSQGPDRILAGSADGVVRFFDYELRQLAELHHLRSGVLWMTERTQSKRRS
jgi:hypothetical protein